MANNPKLQACFSKLETRLYYLRNQGNPIHKDEQEKNIQAIIDGEVFSGDLEETQDNLYYYQNEIEVLLNEIPQITDSLSLPNFPLLKLDPFSPTNVSPDALRSQLMELIVEELLLYKRKLTVILKQTANKLTKLGTNKFSNAGHTVNFLLTNAEIGSLFGAMYDLKIIDNLKEDKKTIYHKNELAEFITRNFTNKNYRPVGIKYLKNNLSQSDISAGTKVLKLLERIENHINQEMSKLKNLKP